MFLFIDPTDQDINTLALVMKKETFWFKFKGDWISENLLTQTKKFLAKHKLDLKDVTKIGVVVGPGPFSKIRTGVTMANALSYIFGIKLVAIKKGSIPKDLSVLLGKIGQKQVRPFYGKNPHITKPKKH